MEDIFFFLRGRKEELERCYYFWHRQVYDGSGGGPGVLELMESNINVPVCLFGVRQLLGLGVR